jgi:Flp pilus assembly protein TadD
VKREPNNAECRFFLGVARLLEGRLAQAVEQFTVAVALAPSNADYRQQLGLALLRMARLDEAHRETSVAVRLAPQRADVHYNHALVLVERGDRRAAVEHLETALALAPDMTAAREQLTRLRKLLEAAGASDVDENSPDACPFDC